MDGLPDLSWLGDLTAVPLAALVTFGVLAIFRGTWTPDRITKMLEKDRDTWKEAYEQERLAHGVTRNHVTKLVEAGRTTERVLSSIPKSDGG